MNYMYTRKGLGASLPSKNSREAFILHIPNLQSILKLDLSLRNRINDSSPQLQMIQAKIVGCLREHVAGKQSVNPGPRRLSLHPLHGS